MAKFGLLMSVYNGMDYLQECLDSWVRYKQATDKLIIAIIDARFQHFDGPDHSTDGTLDLLKKCKDAGYIDYFELANPGLSEMQVRTIPLKFLISNGVDYIISSAPDEMFSVEEIDKIIQYVESEPFITYFKINYKNYVFDKTTWIDTFCPKRIWKVKSNSFLLDSFSGDDDTVYRDSNNGLALDFAFAGDTIPGVKIKHYTWLNNKTSKAKVEYQTKRWAPPHGFGCSYKWNNKENKLEFNEEYYKLVKQSIPKLNKD